MFNKIMKKVKKEEKDKLDRMNKIFSGIVDVLNENNVTILEMQDIIIKLLITNNVKLSNAVADAKK